MIPRTIHQIHLGVPPSDQVRAWMISVREKNPDWEYRLWNEASLSEEGFAAERSLDDLGSWAAVSNAFRLLLLNRFGGIYLDTDFECHLSLNRLPKNGAIAALQDNDRVCNAFMGAPAQHPWVKWQIKHFADYDQRDPASGVYLATAAPREDLTLVDPAKVYPYSYDTPVEARVFRLDNILEHKWQGSWA